MLVFSHLCCGPALQALWEFMMLGLPGGAMMAADAASFDITTAMAGLLGAPPDAACQAFHDSLCGVLCAVHCDPKHAATQPACTHACW